MKKERERVTKDLAQAEVVSRPMDPEKEEPATWAEGDWNRDGRFDQLDLITALQENEYAGEGDPSDLLDRVLEEIEMADIV